MDVEVAADGVDGSIPAPGCVGLNPSDTMPAKSKSSSPPLMEMRTEFLVEILRSSSLLLLPVGSMAGVVEIRTDGDECWRSW